MANNMVSIKAISCFISVIVKFTNFKKIQTNLLGYNFKNKILPQHLIPYWFYCHSINAETDFKKKYFSIKKNHPSILLQYCYCDSRRFWERYAYKLIWIQIYIIPRHKYDFICLIDMNIVWDKWTPVLWF